MQAFNAAMRRYNYKIIYDFICGSPFVSRIFGRLLVCLVSGLLAFGGSGECIAGKLTFGRALKTVALDPGHGGYDTGAKGPGGTLEKQVTLALARMVADVCQENYRVVLTRTDDYRLGIFDRTAAANHVKADLLISIHTGGSFLHLAQGLHVYFYEDSRQSGPPAEPVPDLQPPDAAAPSVPWDRLQARHRPASRQLAAHVHRHLVRRLHPASGNIQGLPLAVLQGADMPAVLVEVGYLTHPATEKNLTDTAFLTAAAEAIRSAIDEYFSTPPPD